MLHQYTINDKYNNTLQVLYKLLTSININNQEKNNKKL